MARRKRARANNRWPKGTVHYVMQANGELINMDQYSDKLYQSKQEIQRIVAWDNEDARAGILMPPEFRFTALVHVMPKDR
jgi:hypothetical protein